MVNVLVIYYSRTGNTETMAKEVERGAREGGAAGWKDKRITITLPVHCYNVSE